MHIQFEVDFINKKFYATFKGNLNNKGITTTQFLLNRDFIIKELKCNGKKIDVESIKMKTIIDDHVLNKYILPQDVLDIEISYTGTLDGTTGMCPYVRETIDSRFTFIRWETFSYPIFAMDDFDDILNFLNSKIEFSSKIIVPNSHLVLSPCELISEETIGEKAIFNFNGCDLSFAIGKYKRTKLPVGDFYFFDNMSYETIDMITNILDEAYRFMNANFGYRDIDSCIKYVSIPDKFGSFANEKCVFVEEGTYSSKISMKQIIHEFIHLGWNAKAEGKTQRIRFFDEAYTNYFTLRVLEDILSHEEYLCEVNRYKSINQKNIEKGIVPISEYGNYECGDLSYTTGALCVYELCKLMGKEQFDAVTKIFLEKYRNESVTIDGFCNEYISLGKNKGLEEFFRIWIYDIEGPKYVNDLSNIQVQ